MDQTLHSASSINLISEGIHLFVAINHIALITAMLAFTFVPKWISLIYLQLS